MMRRLCSSRLIIILWIMSLAVPSHSQRNTLPLSKGASPKDVIKVFGAPDMTVDIPNTNQEIWTYHNKNVILQDHQLLFIDTQEVHTFKIGSPRVDIILAQGFPERIFHLDSLDQEIWFYSTAFVTISDNKVVEWNDYDNILNLEKGEDLSIKVIQIGQSKDEIVKAVGYPHAITKIPSLQEEIWHYDQNNITFKEGMLKSFDRQNKAAAAFRGIFKNDGNPDTDEIFPGSTLISGVTAFLRHDDELDDYRGVYQSDGNPMTEEGIQKASTIEKANKEILHRLGEDLIHQRIRHFFTMDIIKNITQEEESKAISESTGTSMKPVFVHHIFGFEFKDNSMYH